MLMDNHIRRLPILNHDKKLVGIISLADFANGDGDPSLAAQILEHVTQPISAPEHA